MPPYSLLLGIIFHVKNYCSYWVTIFYLMIPGIWTIHLMVSSLSGSGSHQETHNVIVSGGSTVTKQFGPKRCSSRETLLRLCLLRVLLHHDRVS